MRAVAVLAVFANHLFEWPPGGFVGVDVFFVISGFLITDLLIRERTANRKLDFGRFYVRRAKRILPSALLVLTATVLASYLIFPPFRARETLTDALYAALFVSNFRFESVGQDYFQQDLPPSPLQHYWSLSIEEQFYFVWPALIGLIFIVTRRRFGTLPKRQRRQVGLTAAMSCVVLMSFGWAMFASAVNPNTAYFSTFSRVWELGVGALVAISAPLLERIPSTIRPPLAYAGLAGVFGSLFLIDASTQFPAPWAALPVLSTAVVVGAFCGGEVRRMSVLTNPVARYFGDVSYTLYLWHFPVIVLLQGVLPKTQLFYVLSVALALGLTALTYHFYEDPIRKSGWLLPTAKGEDRKNRRSILLAASSWRILGSLGAVVVLVSILQMSYNDKISAAQEDIAQAARDRKAEALNQVTSPEVPNQCFGAPAMLNAGCDLPKENIPVQPPLNRLTADVSADSRNCYIREGQDPQPCVFGYSGTDAKRIALVGESHATSLLPALKPILFENKWQLTTLTGFECKFIEPLPPKCPFGDRIEEQLIANPYDLVLFAQFNRPGITPQNYLDAWVPIAETGARIAVMSDNPMTSQDALTCVMRSRFDPEQIYRCGTEQSEAFPYPDPISTAAKAVDGATLIDLTYLYCRDDFCPSVIGDVIVYRDRHHITATFARTLAGPLEEALQRAFSAPKPAAR